ncbi:MAG: carboxy terminal-processing peptidase [Verrucomicrobiales bacterium]|jgi:carboxyl-terminal processing protease|nr:carboxy terminal-processing peptidase [Verrucomicrobiales bacterium]
MRLNNCIPGLALAFSLALTACGQPADSGAKTKPAPVAANAADAQIDQLYRHPAVLVTRFLEEEHFAHHAVDAATSREWIENYMKNLDYNHLFFLQGDVEQFVSNDTGSIAANIRKGDFRIAFDIYQLFRARSHDRMQWVARRLDQPFDFSVDAYYTPDRAKADWPADQAAADQIWEARLKYDVLTDRLGEKKKTASSVQTIKKRYELFKKNLDLLDHEDVIETYLTSLSALYDPHTSFMSRKSEEDFKIAMQLKLVGIGAVLSSKDGYCTIEEIIGGGPADLDKRLKPGDKIIAVAQGGADYVDVIDMPLRNAVRLIRGDKGTAVRLKIIPAAGADSAREEIKLVRDEVKVNQQRAKARLIQQAGADGKVYKIGVIKLGAFYNAGLDSDAAGDGDRAAGGCSDDVKRLIDRLKQQGLDGLILDLRGNGGGLLTEAVKLVGLFIDQGPVVQVKDSQGRRQTLEDNTPGLAYDGLLLVMTNKLSASASEIAAGALQNYRRAIIVGDQSTHGKGTVQTVAELRRFIPSIFGEAPDSGSLKLTIQKFYLPNGHSTQMRGVIPDIQLPSALDYLELGEANLPHALPWDEIETTKFTPWRQPCDAALPTLAKDSAARVAADPDFKLLQDDIARVKKRLEDKRASLNETKRVAEDAENKKRTEERDQAIKAISAKLPPVVTFSFDDKNSIAEKIGNDADDEKKPADPGDGDEEPADKKLTTMDAFAADLSLRESARILAEWLNLPGGGAVTAKK